MKESPLFSNIQTGEAVYDNVDRATYKGITLKTCFLLLISTIIAAFVAFGLPKIIANNSTTFYVTLAVSSIVGFISVIIGRTSERKAKYASVIYAVCEGLFLGTISAIVESYVSGAVAVAVFSTLVLFAIMLTLFGTGIIKASGKYRSICFGLTIGAIALALLSTLLGVFVFNSYEGSIWLIVGIEVFLLFYGVITLGLNFAEASNVVNRGASKGAEWSVALGLMVSIVYIYIEVLRLIFYISARND